MVTILRLAGEQAEVGGYVSPKLAGAIAAVALVVGGAGAFQATRGDTEPAAASTGVTARRTPAADESRGVYLVSSQEQADAARARLDDGTRAIRSYDVMVVGSVEEETQAWRALAEQNRVRRDNGLPEIETVDLRASGGTGTVSTPARDTGAPLGGGGGHDEVAP